MKKVFWRLEILHIYFIFRYCVIAFAKNPQIPQIPQIPSTCAEKYRNEEEMLEVVRNVVNVIEGT